MQGKRRSPSEGRANMKVTRIKEARKCSSRGESCDREKSFRSKGNLRLGPCRRQTHIQIGSANYRNVLEVACRRTRNLPWSVTYAPRTFTITMPYHVPGRTGMLMQRLVCGFFGVAPKQHAQRCLRV